MTNWEESSWQKYQYLTLSWLSEDGIWQTKCNQVWVERLSGTNFSSENNLPMFWQNATTGTLNCAQANWEATEMQSGYYGYSLRGMRAVDHILIVGGKRLSIIGAMLVDGIEDITSFSWHNYSYSVVVMDNASIHLEIIHGVEVLVRFLPLYSLDFNPIYLGSFFQGQIVVHYLSAYICIYGVHYCYTRRLHWFCISLRLFIPLTSLYMLSLHILIYTIIMYMYKEIRKSTL